MLAWDIYVNQKELPAVHWPGFWLECLEEKLFFTE
jgi:hypothetical protein